jgi:serine/threonine protein kinase
MTSTIAPEPGMHPGALLTRRASTPVAPVGESGSGTTLPGEVLPDAGRRIRAVAIAFAAIWSIVLLLFNVVGPALGSLPAGRRLLWPMPGNAIAGTGAVISLVLAWLARRLDGRTAPLIAAGSAFLVVTCFLFGLLGFWVPRFDVPVPSWIGLVILAYLGIVPSTPAATRSIGLVAATMAPLAVAVVALSGIEVHATPFEYLLAFFPNYLCAGLAVVHARLIRGLGRRAREARELGSYRLEQLLSRGGMGEVYRASHRMLARPAAIKLIRPEVLGGADHAQVLRERFRREAEVAASLRSPHTIGLYDFGAAQDGRLFLVMELLDGVDLETLVRRHGRVSPARAVHLLRQACHSLEEAHARGLIHRDIKPSNIFACRMGLAVDFVKVLDFGLVKARDDRDIRLTAPNRTAGTPAYIAPEMVLGTPDVDHRADIYCLGCVAYWLLTGRMVFEGDAAVHLMLQHAHATPVPPSQRAELVIPPALERLVLDCLSKSPHDRPQTAGELSRRLAAAVECSEAWTDADAAAWWRDHRPQPVPAECEATTQRAGWTTGVSGVTLSPTGPASLPHRETDPTTGLGSLITSTKR